jgi:type I restriction enzyme M protein
MDASKLGEKKKVDGNQRTILSQEDINQIIFAFHACQNVDDFCVAVSAEEVVAKNYSFSAGQYFDIKIEYVDITAEEFEARIANYEQTLAEQFAESHQLEQQIMEQLKSLKLK